MDLEKIIEKIIDRIEKKIDTLDNKVDTIKIEQKAQGINIDRNTEDLAHHIKRCDTLEKKLEQVEKPHIWMSLSVKILGVISTLTGILYIIYRLI